MLGRNHAIYGASAWMLAGYPMAVNYAGIEGNAHSKVVVGMTSLIAAGAAVVPDLDHPDSRPAEHFGLLSKAVSKVLEAGAGGHRAGTHSLVFPVLLGLALWGSSRLVIGNLVAAVVCACCVSIGLALIGPSLGLRVPALMHLAAGAGVGWWVWGSYDEIKPMLWMVIAAGSAIHIICDAVTKGGVPLLMPLTRKRFGIPLFDVGGTGEGIAAAVGLIVLIVTGWERYGPG